MSNQVEVEVVLSGAEEAKRGLSSIGETAGSMAERFNSENSKLGEGLSSITDNVGELASSMGEFGAVATSVAKGTGASMMSLLPAVGAVIAAGFALYETFLNISGAAQEAEDAEEAMAAAAADLESKLEALAEKGVIPSVKALDQFTRATLQAQLAKEANQKAVEKLKDEITNLREAEQRLESERSRQGTSILFSLKSMFMGVNTLKLAQDELTEATAAYTAELAKVEKEHLKNQERLKGAEEQYKALEETSVEAVLAKTKENLALLTTLQLRAAEIDLTDKALEQKKLEIDANKELFSIAIEENKEKLEGLRVLKASLDMQIATFDQSKQIMDLRAKRILALDKEETKQAKRSIKRIDDQRIKEMALERQKQADLRVLRQLELQQMALDGASALQIANERYRDELIAAEGNHEKGLIAAKRYEIALTQINQQEATKREQAETQRRQREEEMRKQASALAYSSLEFDLQMMSEGLDKEIALLTLRYERERNLNAATQNEITELNRREAIERERIIEASTQAQIEQIGQFASSYGAGLAEAAYSSLLFGESFTKATGQILIALGRQAAIQSLMELAEGTAALFKPFGQAEAAGHFKAAAIFAGVSAAAGVTGKSMGGGGGAAGGGGGGATPSGAPTQAPAPQREQAEQAPMVFNINFGGAVIYDTQRAAEQAMADRITTLQNTRRRGAPRR